MAELKNSQHILSPGDKSYPHCHSVITGRKSWKTLKGKTEAVWPPYLEVALFEGAPSNPTLIISTLLLIIPALQVSLAISPPTREPPNHSADFPTGIASYQNISSKRPANIELPSKLVVGSSNCAIPTRESSVCPIALVPFFPDFCV